LVKAADQSRPDLNRIHIATSFKDAEILVSNIRSSGCEILGFDMEWKPEYSRGEQNPIALIQLATDTEVMLFHLPSMSFRIPTCLKNLLEDPKIKKIGFGLSEDMKKLCSQKISVKASYDLDLLIKSLGCIKTSLQSLAARVLDIYIDKRKKNNLFELGEISIERTNPLCSYRCLDRTKTLSETSPSPEYGQYFTI